MMKYSKLTVSEPWDFKSSSGANALEGKVISQIDERNLIFETTESVELQGVKGALWVLSLRYQGDSFNKPDKTKTVGGGILLAEDFSNHTAKELQRMSKFVVIGSLS